MQVGQHRRQAGEPHAAGPDTLLLRRQRTPFADAAGQRAGNAQRRGLLGLREGLPGILSGGRRRRRER